MQYKILDFEAFSTFNRFTIDLTLDEGEVLDADLLLTDLGATTTDRAAITPLKNGTVRVDICLIN